MRIAIDAGHNCPPADLGAMGILNEQVEAAEVAKHLGTILGRGHEVLAIKPKDGSTETASLADRCRLSNEGGAELFVSIHFNAFTPTDGPRGTEVYATSTKGGAIAESVERQLSELGFKSRGVKEGDHLFVLRHTKAVAVLIEICFVDSTADAELYRKIGAQGIAQAIAVGLVGGAIPTQPQPKGTAAYESTPLDFDPEDIDWANPRCKVSKYFTVGEVTRGDARRIPPRNDKTVINNILNLAQELDKLREAWGSPIGVTSWYRPPLVNKAVGGVPDSQHITGRGVDVFPMQGDIDAFQRFCDQHWYGALGRGAKKGFVHLDTRNGRGFELQGSGSKGVRWEY